MGSDEDTARPPDGLPTSRSGRTPQWVLDELAGGPTTPAPWRSAGGPPTPPPRRRRAGTALGLALCIAAAGGVVALLDVPSSVPGQEVPAALDGPPPGLDEKDDRLRPEPALRESTAYRFLQQQRDREAPVTYSPCRPIRYVVRPDNVPAGAADILTRAVTELGDATGLVFLDAGTTTEGPATDRESYQPERYGKRWAPVLMVWATPEEIPDFVSDTAGQAGSATVTTADGIRHYISGQVALDAELVTTLLADGQSEQVAAVLRHELGHLVGLDHVTDPAQLMFPETGERTTFGDGDLAGLAALGRGPCMPGA